MCTASAGRMTGPVAKSEAWVRVVPSSAVVPGKQADALVAGTREFSLPIFRSSFRARKGTPQRQKLTRDLVVQRS